MKTPFKSIAMLTALAAATSALAVPTGAHWVQVDNSGNVKDGPSTGFDADWLTFDLYVDLEAGDDINISDFGGSGPNAGLTTDGVFFQVGAPFGSDDHVANLTFAEFKSNIEYDTAASLGPEPLLFAGGSMTWDEAGVIGTWFAATQGNAAPGPSVHLARITVSAGTTYLGGEMFVSGNWQNGHMDPSVGVVYVPNAIPTPGALTLFAFCAATAIRRKRKNIGAIRQ